MAKDLEYYLAQARRIAAHREEGAEEAIRKEFKKLLKDLKAYIGEVHEKYAAADGTLSFADLQKAGYDARFLEEIERRIGVATPRVAKELHKLVNETYELSYKSMVEGVEKVAKGADLGETFSDAVAITPEQIKAAVSNPYMENALLRNHQSIVYDIRQAVAVGLMNGDRYTTIANKITVALDKENGPYKNAVLIARTEAHRVREAGNNDAAAAVDTELQKGTTGMRMCKTWKTMKDERVRPQRRRKGKGGWSSKMGKGANHMKLEGQTVLASDLFDLLDHNTAPAPGSSGVAAHDCNCRCYASFAMLTDAEFFALSGKHFPGYEKQKKKPLPKIDDAIDFGYGNYTDEDYNKWWDEYEARNKHVKLSAKELEVIDNYTEGAFIGYNGVSRGEIASLKKKGFTEAEIEKARKDADILEGALHKFELDTNIVTHRFESDVSWLTGTDNSVEALEKMIGKQYTSKGFTSSGMLPNRFRFTGGKSDAVHFEIVTPKGTDGAFLYMSKKGENEFLYNRNTRFQIIDGGERIIKEHKLDIKTMKMVEVDVKERFLKVQVVLDDVAKDAAKKAVKEEAKKKVAEKVVKKEAAEKAAEKSIKKTAFKPADSVDDAQKYALNTLGLKSTNYSMLNIDVANMVNKEIQSMYDLFGNINEAGHLGGIRVMTGKKSFVAAYSAPFKEVILLRSNVGYKSSIKKMSETAKRMKELGFWSTGDAEHFVRHEVGHAIQHWLTDNDAAKLNKISVLRQQVMKDCGITNWSMSDSKENMAKAGNVISYYALQKDGEFIAEAIAEYIAGNPRSVAKKVVEILLEGR